MTEREQLEQEAVPSVNELLDEAYDLEKLEVERAKTSRLFQR